MTQKLFDLNDPNFDPTVRLPNSNQSFASIRSQNLIYVDKTRFIYALARDNKPKFISRPRRFGKSTLVSTLEELFAHGIKGYDGHDSYFKGLEIEKLWQDEKVYKIMRLSFSEINYETKSAAEFKLSFIKTLDSFAKLFEIEIPDNLDTIAKRFAYLLSKLEDHSLVLLVDEYDAPLTSRIDLNSQDYQDIVKIIQGFYGIIKEWGHKFRCVFITGITRYKDAALFTAGNSVKDLSQDPRFGEICGYTLDEIKNNFKEQILFSTAQAFNLKLEEVTTADQEKLLDKLAFWYDGYCFDQAGLTHVFSTWSVLQFFADPLGCFDNYWYNSGGQPKILQKAFLGGDVVKTLNDLAQEKLAVSLSHFINPSSLIAMDRKVLLFQTGYLTLAKAYRGRGDSLSEINQVQLKFPNHETISSFKKLLGDFIFNNHEEEQDIFSIYRVKFIQALLNHSQENLINVFNTVINTVDCFHFPIKEESMLSALLAIFMMSCGAKISVSEHQASGILDTKVSYQDTTLVIEYKFLRDKEKLSDKLQTALTQIVTKDYGNTLHNLNPWRLAIVYSQAQRKIVASQEV